MSKQKQRCKKNCNKDFRDKMGCVFCEYFEDWSCMFEENNAKCPFSEDLKDCKNYMEYTKSIGSPDARQYGGYIQGERTYG